MRILLWHGYLLSGTGSNIYGANVARAWRAQGHTVVLMCQDRDAGTLPFVDGYVDMATDALPEIDDGTCTVVRPDIGSLLPVYLYDEYPGFVVKRFVDLTDPELETYTQRNVRAMESVIRWFEPDAIITGHEVMGPYIAKLACAATKTEYAAKLHGSALEYAVRLQDRYLHYATEGLTAARAVVGGSRYMVDAAASVIPGWHHKSSVVNPGCDVELFRPSEAIPSGRPRLAYVGKLISQKGVHHLLAALGLTRTPELELEIIGFGGSEAELRELATALGTGDRGTIAGLARRLDDPVLSAVKAFLSAPLSDDYRARAASATVTFAGRLEHGPLAEVLPHFEALAVPSVLPEAFGMVAAEAAACAVLPIVPRHSGIGEVGATLEQHVARPGLLTFDPDEPIEALARAIDRVLTLDRDDRRELGRACSELARERWSWDTVARNLLVAAGALP